MLLKEWVDQPVAESAVMGFHGLRLERIANGKFFLDTRNRVEPNETFRIVVSGIRWDGAVDFVFRRGSVEVFRQQIGVNLSGDGWIDIAFDIEGQYTVEVETTNRPDFGLPFIPTGSHSHSLSFSVTSTAPDPQHPGPEGTFDRLTDSFTDLFENAERLILFTIGGLVLIQGIGLARQVKR